MDILQEIIAIDKAAAARVEAVREEQSRRVEETGRSAASADEQTVQTERRRLEALREEQEKALAEKQKSTAQAQETRIRQLEDIFASSRSRWIADIIAMVTEV